MSHGGESEGGESSERWLVSYSDFITLLMVLFVVLYSMGKTDVQKYKRLAESMRSAFTLGGPVQVVDSQISVSGGTNEDGKSKPIVIPGIPEGPPQSVEVAGELTKMLSDQNMGNEISVQTNIEGILISISQKLMFIPDKDLHVPKEIEPILDIIVNMVKSIPNPIRLVGHTDDSPPSDPRFKDNWDLSVARAQAVAEYLISKGIDPARLTISGRGGYDPLFPNDTPEHRQLNGRVDIIIIYSVDKNVIGSSPIKVAP
jgi:chemotaxis protein MotB